VHYIFISNLIFQISKNYFGFPVPIPIAGSASNCFFPRSFLVVIFFPQSEKADQGVTHPKIRFHLRSIFRSNYYFLPPNRVAYATTNSSHFFSSFHPSQLTVYGATKEAGTPVPLPLMVTRVFNTPFGAPLPKAFLRHRVYLLVKGGYRHTNYFDECLCWWMNKFIKLLCGPNSSLFI